MKRINHIAVVLIIALACIAALEFIALLREYAVFVVLGTLTVLFMFLVSLRQKPDAALAALIFCWFLGAAWLFPLLDSATLVLRAAAISSFLLLSIVLLIGPWSYISAKVLQWYKYRRHLGVASFLLAWLHVGLVMSLYFHFSIDSALENSFTVFGITAFMIMFLLAVTSWDKVQKKVRHWQWVAVHAASFFGFIAIVFKWYSIQKDDPQTPIFVLFLGLFGLFWILSSPLCVSLFMKTKPFGWKQVHVLVHVAYPALVLHVYVGVLAQKSLTAQLLFFSVPGLVYFSHARGWVCHVLETRRSIAQIRSINKTVLDSGETFVGVGYLSDLAQGKGMKVVVSGRPLALFLKGAQVYALSNVCAHQKGPLHKGKMLGEYVECPWHQWNYGLKDGCGPPGFSDCVPCHKVKVIDDIAYISERPAAKQQKSERESIS